MKTKVELVLLIAFLFRLPLNCQDIEKLQRWSVSIGYYPLYEFNLSKQIVAANDAFYWYSLSGRISYKLSNKYSILTGLRYRKEKFDLHFDLFPNAYYTEVFWEIPIQLNYYFSRHSDFFLPYCKIGVISSFLKSSINEPMQSDHSYFYISSDLGLGSEAKLNDRLGLFCEMSIGYFLKYDYSNRAYINGFLAFRYNLK